MREQPFFVTLAQASELGTKFLEVRSSLWRAGFVKSKVVKPRFTGLKKVTDQAWSTSKGLGRVLVWAAAKLLYFLFVGYEERGHTLHRFGHR